MFTLCFAAIAAIATGTGGVPACTHVQFESAVAASSGSERHRFHRLDSTQVSELALKQAKAAVDGCGHSISA